MTATGRLSNDPYNLIITGVGGQGNVIASRIIGDILSAQGLYVTIGETFGASQRGGSVMSHLRLSAQMSFSPQIPRGRAHTIVALEPMEALRVLKDYGNPEVKVICNTRPIYSIDVICGEKTYPSIDELRSWISKLSETVWFIDTTEAAMKLGNPIFGNIMAVGALAGTGVIPLDREIFRTIISSRIPPDKVDVNMEAFDAGKNMIALQG